MGPWNTTKHHKTHIDFGYKTSRNGVHETKNRDVKIIIN
jgi:hypothetical protein